jgi:uncharacterized protein YeeX (DUF496 family)
VNEVRAWTVALDAVEDSDEFPRDRRRKNRVRRNLSGIAVELTDGHEREQAAEALNEWLDERERMIEEQYMEIQDRVREIVGEPAELPA